MTLIESQFAVHQLAPAHTFLATIPGQLTMQYFCPPGLRPGAPLVVLLHGCRQDAAEYAIGSGWPTLAARHGFALLLPGQSRVRNPLGCFSWFDPAALTRASGEVGAILGMVEHMAATHQLDRRRLYATGLSAGGAMTAALLAAAPETFAGGAIIAGLPFGAASSAREAFRAMREARTATGGEWGDLVRAASTFEGRRPAVSIWHGTQDRTVSSSNADALEAQWLDVLRLDPAGVEVERHEAHQCRLWRDRAGEVRLRRWVVDGLGHGTPISPNAAEEARRLGQPSRFMLESTLGSTWLLARDWGLMAEPASPASGITGLVQATLRAMRLLP